MANKIISSIKFKVDLIPQTTDGNCAFACMAMVLKYKKLLNFNNEKSRAMAVESLDNCNDHQNMLCYPKEQNASTNINFTRGMSPEQFSGIDNADSNRTFSRMGFVTGTGRPQSPQGLFEVIKKINGPLIFNSMNDYNNKFSHFRVITGMDYCKDDSYPSEESDYVSIIYVSDPWEKGMEKFRGNNKGSQYTINYYDLFNETNKLMRLDNRLGKTIFYVYHH